MTAIGALQPVAIESDAAEADDDGEQQEAEDCFHAQILSRFFKPRSPRRPPEPLIDSLGDLEEDENVPVFSGAGEAT